MEMKVTTKIKNNDVAKTMKKRIGLMAKIGIGVQTEIGQTGMHKPVRPV